MPPFFKLAGRVASYTDVGPEDTRNVKTALSRLGYFKAPEWGITELPIPDMFDGLKKFQKDHDLEPDGVMNADGPTLRKLNQEFGKRTRSAVHGAPPGTTVPARPSEKFG